MKRLRQWWERWVYNRAIALFWRSDSYRNAAELEIRKIRATKCGNWISSMYD